MTTPARQSDNPLQPPRWRALAFEAARFIGSGLLVFPLGLGVAAFCREILGWRRELATAAAFGTLLCVNFAMGRAVVFRSGGTIKHELPRFIAVAVVMRTFESLLSIALLKIAGIPYLASIALVLASSSMLKFFLYRTWVFGRNTPAASHSD